MKEYLRSRVNICICIGFCIIIVILFLHTLHRGKKVLCFRNKTTTFFDGTSTEVEVKNDLGNSYKITCKYQTFSQDNFLDYSIINYPVIQFIDGKVNQELEAKINQLLYEMSMLRYSEELENDINAFYSCDYYILFADKAYISIYYMESIGSGAGRPLNFEDAITISLETGEKVSLNDFKDINIIMKKISNYSGVIYTDSLFEDGTWNENRSEFIKEWKEDEWAEYIGYYFYDGRLGLLFDYYQTGREKIALEFEGILN